MTSQSCPCWDCITKPKVHAPSSGLHALTPDTADAFIHFCVGAPFSCHIWDATWCFVPTEAYILRFGTSLCSPSLAQHHMHCILICILCSLSSMQFRVQPGLWLPIRVNNISVRSTWFLQLVRIQNPGNDVCLCICQCASKLVCE